MYIRRGHEEDGILDQQYELCEHVRDADHREMDQEDRRDGADDADVEAQPEEQHADREERDLCQKEEEGATDRAADHEGLVGRGREPRGHEGAGVLLVAQAHRHAPEGRRDHPADDAAEEDEAGEVVGADRRGEPEGAPADRERGAEEEGGDDALIERDEDHRDHRNAIAGHRDDVLPRDREAGAELGQQLAHQHEPSAPRGRALVSRMRKPQTARSVMSPANASSRTRSTAIPPSPTPRKRTVRMSATMYVGGSSAAPACAHPGSMTSGNVMPQARTNVPRTSWTIGPVSPNRRTDAAKSEPIAYMDGIPIAMTTIASRTGPRGSTIPKTSQTARSIATTFSHKKVRCEIGGAKRATSRDVGVKKTASSEPRICSCRSAVPGPQSRFDSHMYIA